MTAKGLLLTDNNDPIDQWDAGALLREESYNVVRFSKGFLRCHPETIFKSIATDWVPFFSSLSMTVEIKSVTTSLDFPEELARIIPVEVDNEVAVIGFDEDSIKIISSSFANYKKGEWGDLIIEYLERRLLGSLARHWTGEDPLNCHYLTDGDLSSVEVVGAVKCELLLNSKLVSFWCGFGPKLTEMLDEIWRNTISAEQDLAERGKAYIDVILDEIEVPSTLVVDYLQSGSLIDLGKSLDGEVLVKKDNEPWVRGELCQFNGRFAVAFKEFIDEPASSVVAKTKIGIQICNTELTSRSVIEHSQIGAVLLTGTAISDLVTLRIAGEIAAYGRLGVINGNFIVMVLERN